MMKFNNIFLCPGVQTLAFALFIFCNFMFQLPTRNIYLQGVAQHR